MDNKNTYLSPEELWHERHKYPELVDKKYPDYIKEDEFSAQLSEK